MHSAGLVSISFREHTPEHIIAASSRCGLTHIEWGSDVHAPYDNLARLKKLAALQAEYGISCCSYGTYFRLGHSPIEELPNYIRAAKILGTNLLRLWCGRKKQTDCTEEERQYLFSQCAQAAELAEKEGVILCLECHRRSYTENKEGALELMEAIRSPNFRMYWQPNPDISLSDNLDYIEMLNPYITHVHVFNWIADQRLPLRDGLDTWQTYLSALTGNHHLLLEFMPDDRIESLSAETDALQKIMQTATVLNLDLT